MIKILLIAPIIRTIYSGPGVTMTTGLAAGINFDLRWDIDRKRASTIRQCRRVIKIENTSIMSDRLISFQYGIDEHDDEAWDHHFWRGDLNAYLWNFAFAPSKHSPDRDF